jgi:hypothetical protein
MFKPTKIEIPGAYVTTSKTGAQPSVSKEKNQHKLDPIKPDSNSPENPNPETTQTRYLRILATKSTINRKPNGSWKQEER